MFAFPQLSGCEGMFGKGGVCPNFRLILRGEVLLSMCSYQAVRGDRNFVAGVVTPGMLCLFWGFLGLLEYGGACVVDSHCRPSPAAGLPA